MEPVISVDNVSVRFRRGRRPGINSAIRRAAPAFLRGKQVEQSRYFWALRDITFDVQAGEAVGLVGGNGSGKSTLLKVVAGSLLPDRGTARINGGVAPLIEVSGGFVSDLTARENISIIGGLHGLSKQQIRDRFDEIVEFAEIEDFIDTPFRHFSSGMKARLGFAVITQLEQPIVLVDEAMAVGDRRFRLKCYDRLDTMLGEGRTLFLVSHNDNDLRRFCKRGLYMKRGKLVLDSDIDTALATYAGDSGAGRA